MVDKTTPILEDTVEWLPAGFFILNDTIKGHLDTLSNHVTDIFMQLYFMDLGVDLDPTDEMDAVTIVCDKAVESLSKINGSKYDYKFAMADKSTYAHVDPSSDIVVWSVHLFVSEV